MNPKYIDYYPDGEDINILFWDQSNYKSLEDAQRCGADYSVPSSISLYGSSGLHDLSEVVRAVLNCLGNDDVVACVHIPNHGWVEVEELLRKQPVDCKVPYLPFKERACTRLNASNGK
jgi:hypothetical protein